MPYSKNISEITKIFATDAHKGLTEAAAAELLTKHGYNKLREKPKKTLFARVLSQLSDVMVIILLIAAVISFVLAFLGDDPEEFFEPVLILLIVVINAVMGVMQESKAEKSLDALKSLSAPNARVIRGGAESIIAAENLVPGDLIHLEAGDFVPADSRLVRSQSLKSEESALTGESVPSEKHWDAAVPEKAGIGDRTNMVFSGCAVSYGSAEAIVVATGMDTEMGKIAGLLEGEGESATPLQQKLAQLGKYLGFVALAACAVIFILGVVDGLPILEMFMTAVSLAVSAIPEGLPAIVTIVLSIGVSRMVKQNAIIRRLPAVETLGSASVICSDKTGTLTQNRMTLVKAYPDDGELLTINPSENTDEVNRLLKYGTLCSDGSVTVGDDGKVTHIGDPTETAIVLAALEGGMSRADLNTEYNRVTAIPFDSDRKLMSVVVKDKTSSDMLVIVKGAFDILAKKCVAGDIAKAVEKNEEMSRNALRVLGIAVKTIDKVSAEPAPDELENGLTFLGLVGMIDPPRPECADAVAVARGAGIKPVMITGDHVTTAAAIAKQLDIFREGDKAVTGAELDEMSDEQLAKEVEHISVYARVSPENKIRIVKAWQADGKVVSMTGDGVNDAPALKAADIGCAMGITGTDVAKGAADMILTDDNFTTIVRAIKEGRGIYANIKKVICYLLGTNVGEVLTVFFAMIIWRDTPLVAMQLLWINLVTDSLPAIALGMEPVEKNIMDQPPVPKNEGVFANGAGARMIAQGAFFAILTLLAYYIGEYVLPVSEAGAVRTGQTMAFFVLAMCQIVQSFNMRSMKSLFKIGFFTNKNLNKMAGISLLLMVFVLFTPVVNEIFGLLYLTPELYAIACGLSLAPLPFMEIWKLISNSRAKNKK